MCITGVHLLVAVYWLQQWRWVCFNSHSASIENGIVCYRDSPNDKSRFKPLSLYTWQHQVFQRADPWDYFQDFEPTSLLFPIYRNIEIHSYGKVLLHISTFVSSFNSQIFTDLSLVSESGKFYLSDCYPRNIEDNSQYVKENKAIQKAKEKRAAEWGEFLSILKKHGKLIE